MPLSIPQLSASTLKRAAKLLAATLKSKLPPPVIQTLISNPALLRALIDELSELLALGSTMNTKQKVIAALLKQKRPDLANVVAGMKIRAGKQRQPNRKLKVRAAVAPEDVKWLKIKARGLDTGGEYGIIPLDKNQRMIPSQHFKDKKVQQVLNKSYQHFDEAHDAGQSVFRNAMVSASTKRVQAGSWQEKVGAGGVITLKNSKNDTNRKLKVGAAKKLTRQQAIDKLTKTRQLSTEMLEPLGISMDTFLQYAQFPTSRQKKMIDDAIKFYGGKTSTFIVVVNRSDQKDSHAGKSFKEAFELAGFDAGTLFDVYRVLSVDAGAARLEFSKYKPIKSKMKVTQDGKIAQGAVKRVQAGSWQEKAKAELEAELGGFESEYGRNSGRDYFSLEADGRADNGESEWIVFKDWKAAEQYAYQYVQEMLDDDPTMFNQDFLKQHLYVWPTDIRIIANEEADHYLENIRYEGDERVLEEGGMLRGYEGMQDKIDKLEEQMLEEMDPKKSDRMQKQIDKLEAAKEKLVDKAADKISDDYTKEITKRLKDDPVDYAEELGFEIGKTPWLQIDTRKAAEDAVDTDGVAHFLDGYDGEEVELPSGAVAFGTN